MLWEKNRHELLKPLAWDQDTVNVVLSSIYDETEKSLDQRNFWPTTADESDIPHTLYAGALGTLWAWNQLAGYLNKPLSETGIDNVELIENIYTRYLKEPDTGNTVPSLFLGEVGLLLYRFKLNPTAPCASRIYELVAENIENPTLEALWGAPGTMLAATYMFDWTTKEKWKQLYLENASFLIRALKNNIKSGLDIWTQDFYGAKIQYLGAGHGYFGNMFGILKGLALLSSEDREFIIHHVIDTSLKYAIQENGLVNWPPLRPPQTQNRILVQWCHGAPGVITSLESFPPNVSTELECLLLGAGELIFKAGPLRKGVGLCHGTDGNAMALLGLYHRTGNVLWLDRARCFAMHAITQRANSFSFFTGDLGLAHCLIACSTKQPGLGFLDYV